MNGVGSASPEVQGPRWLLAELSYRCPLRCSYCSNPADYETIDAELDTDAWKRVLSEARALGAVQLGFSGGEPLVRADLEELVAHARGLGYYVNLVTSGVGLTDGRIARLKNAGLDHIQLSVQGADAKTNDWIAGAPTFARKLAAARRIKAHGFPMVLNVVLHRHNLHQVPALLALADELGADYLELANAQYDGWAASNRDALLPSPGEVEAAETALARYREGGGKVKVFFVVPDYLAGRPKPCGGGWAKHMLVVAPDGLALPCHGARKLPLPFPNVRDLGVAAIWRESAAFRAYRGEGWMPEPCRSCPERDKDFGGCRCQAFLLTGDAAATDPACDRSPAHALVLEAARRAEAPARVSRPLIYRDGMPAGHAR